ncbi:MAG TPA: hypothetical protein VM939_01660, partial [Gemmatimonadaceae bacterium]|nr:hypothetical protein [Gemmatimonadaceae bacterium]
MHKANVFRRGQLSLHRDDPHILDMTSSRQLLFAAATAASLLSACAYSSPSPARTSAAAIATTVQEANVRRLLFALADDSLEGRRVGTAGEKRAAAIIAREMQVIGLQAAGDSGYFQRVPLRSVVGRNGRPRFALADSWAGLDTVPAERRGVGLNVIGIIPGSEPALRDQVVLFG